MLLPFAILLVPIFPSAFAAEPHIEKLHVASPWRVEIFARDLDEPRELALGAKGTVFVGTRGNKVYAIPSGPGSHAGKTRVIAQGLDTPNGVAFHDGSLYVAEISRV